MIPKAEAIEVCIHILEVDKKLMMNMPTDRTADTGTQQLRQARYVEGPTGPPAHTRISPQSEFNASKQ